jgi:branched-chain amino acid transport system substrate-binding protein
MKLGRLLSLVMLMMAMIVVVSACATVEDTAATAVEGVGEAVEAVATEAGEIAATAVEAVEDAGEAAATEVGEVIATVGEAAEAVATEAGEVAATAVEAVEDAGEAVATEVGEAVEAVATAADSMMAMGPSVMVAPDEPLKLGFAAALSGEGLAPFGTDIRRGVEMALAARPTVTVDGVEFAIEVDAQDSLCSPEGGQTVANRFASDEAVVAVIGPMCSSACEAAMPIFDEALYTSISASCTNDGLTKMGSVSFNRTVAPDGLQSVVAAEFLYNVLGVRQIAVLDDGSAYGEGLANLVVAEFEALGGEVVARDAVTVGDTDFRALLQEVEAAAPELVYFAGFNAEAARLLEQMGDVGLEDTPFMGADGIFGPELISLAGAASEGVYASRPVPVEGEALDAHNALYEETFGEAPLSAFNTNSYDATNLLLNAIEAVGVVDERGDLVVDREALAEYMDSATLSGLTGEVVCDVTGECSAAEIGIYQVVDGVYTRLDAMGEPMMMAPVADEGMEMAADDMAPMGPVSAIFMEITNNSDADVTLVGGATDVANIVEIHENIMENDVMKMRPLVDGLVIPAGETVVLQPGGYHVMLVDVVSNLVVGEAFDTTLNFEGTDSVTLAVPISEDAVAEGEFSNDALTIVGFWARSAAVDDMAQDSSMGGDDAPMAMGPSVMVAPDEPLKLGFAAALSGEGLAPFGTDILRGVEMALAARPAVTVDGVEFAIEVDAQDSLCSPEGGQTVANRFASDEAVVAVIGPMCSSACEAAMPIFDEALYTSISASCTNDGLTKMGSVSFNRTVAPDGLQSVVAAEFLYNVLGVRQIAVLDDGSAYGEGLANLVVAEFEALGGEVVARDAVTVGDTDFRALLQEVEAAAPELVYFAGFNAEAARLLEQMGDVGLEDTPFMGADGIFGPELISLAGAASEGVYASRPVPVEGEALDAHNALYEETFGEAPLSAFNTNSYDATNLLLNAIEAVGVVDERGDLVVDRAALAEYMDSATLSGLTGEVVCDVTGECSAAEIGIYQVVDGVYTPVEN